MRLINSGISPIHEEGLDGLLRKNISAGRLRASTKLEVAIVNADISIIAVGTPFDGSEIDLSYIRKSASDIGMCLKLASAYHVVCVKSTVVPGTTTDVVGPILEELSGRKIGQTLGLCMNPEFLAEGSAVKDFMDPDRIVLGVSDQRAGKLMSDAYAPFCCKDILITNPSTAEMCKYAANSLFATAISFSNEIANLCASISNIDALDVMYAVQLDRRLSPIIGDDRIRPGLMSFLLPGTGFGGSCFPKDVKAFQAYGQKNGHNMPILHSVLDTNKSQPDVTMKLIKAAIGDLRGKHITVLGLAFKPGTDDVRESPALLIIKMLLSCGALVNAHDPVAMNSAKEVLMDDNLNYYNELSESILNVDALVLVTSWPEYKNIELIEALKNIPIIDGRRFLDKQKFPTYFGIGCSNF